MLEAAERAEIETLEAFYADRLHHYFSAPRHLFRHLVSSDRPQAALRADIDLIDRYLNEAGHAALDQLRVLVQKKDDLDFQYALQLAMKAWLLVHVPLTYSLLLLALLHAILVHAFAGAL